MEYGGSTSDHRSTAPLMPTQLDKKVLSVIFSQAINFSEPLGGGRHSEAPGPSLRFVHFLRVPLSNFSPFLSKCRPLVFSSTVATFVTFVDSFDCFITKQNARLHK